MDELATGGPVGPDNNKAMLFDGDYIIPLSFAKEWARKLLEEINRSELDKPDSV